MIERLQNIEKRYNELVELLSNPEVLSDIKKTTELSKEQASLRENYEAYQEYKKVISNIEAAKEMMKDPEMVEFARDEYASNEEKRKQMEADFEIMLLPKDPNDGKDVIVEIRGAAGGDEANIFAGDLFRMYSRYAEKNGWKLEIIHEVPGASGGYAGIEFIVKGTNVYSKLKYESGSHRVQRVPSTETQGRVHTSTATVLVMPEVETVNIEVKESDLKIDVYHSSGAGGQSVNTANSAVRITHVPTGIVVTCQTERSQLRNKERALNLLKIKIKDAENQAQENEVGAARKSKIGSGDRSEKIRTYNYPQNRVTDHRINFSVMNLDKVMEGELEQIINALVNEDLKLKLAGLSLK